MSDYQEVKTPIDNMHSYCSQYRGNSIGRAIHYIYHICGLRISEETHFGKGNVTLYDKPFATVSWDKGYPDFIFVDEQYNERQRRLLAGEIVGHLF